MNATELLTEVREARQSFIEATDVTDELDMAALFAARFSELDILLQQGAAPPADWTASLPAEELLTTTEVATLFRVDRQTVRRWTLAGKLTDIKTPGRHRRFRATEVRALYAGAQQEPAAAWPGTGASNANNSDVERAVQLGVAARRSDDTSPLFPAAGRLLHERGQYRSSLCQF